MEDKIFHILYKGFAVYGAYCLTKDFIDAIKYYLKKPLPSPPSNNTNKK